MKKNMLRNQKGFTLIEIIAVLVILGILAAVAVPKYLDLQADAKVMAAMGEVAELKGTLSSGWGKAFLIKGALPVIGEVVGNSSLTAGGGTVGTTPDIWTYGALSIAGNVVNVHVTQRGTDTAYNASGSWTLPTP